MGFYDRHLVGKGHQRFVRRRRRHRLDVGRKRDLGKFSVQDADGDGRGSLDRRVGDVFDDAVEVSDDAVNAGADVVDEPSDVVVDEPSDVVVDLHG